MNKKLTMIALSMVVGGTMLCTTALASMSGSTGYDVYKTALKNTQQIQSVSATADIQVTDNGAAILKANDNIKANLSSKLMSSNLAVTGGDQTVGLDVYHQQDRTIVKNSDSDVYNVITQDEKHNREEIKNDPAGQAMASDVENIVDLAMGNLKDYITLDKNSDGSKIVSLQLSGSQITPLQNAVASLLVKNGTREHESSDPSTAAVKNIVQANIPKLVSDIQITNVDIRANINNQNRIDEQLVNFSVTGKDAAGKTHDVAVSLDLKLANFNNTTPDTVDLTGQQVKNITPRDFAGSRHE